MLLLLSLGNGTSFTGATDEPHLSIDELKHGTMRMRHENSEYTCREKLNS